MNDTWQIGACVCGAERITRQRSTGGIEKEKKKIFLSQIDGKKFRESIDAQEIWNLLPMSVGYVDNVVVKLARTHLSITVK